MASIPSPAVARARAHLAAGRIAAAEEELRQALVQEPGSADARALLGVAALGRGDAKEAERWLKEALARAPELAWAASNLGLAFQAQGRLAEAIESFRAALAADRRFADAAFNLGVALEQSGDADGAADAYRRALKIDPNHADALNNLGALRDAAGNADEAATLYRRALARNPGSPKLGCNLANALARIGRVDEAEKEYRRAIAQAPDFSEGLSNYGAFLQRRRRLPEALAALSRATAGRDAPAAAFHNFGLALEGAGRMEEALAAYTRASERDPAMIAPRINQAEALRRLGRLGEARAVLEQARRAAPTDGRVLAAAMSLALYICDWRTTGALAPALDGATRAALRSGGEVGESPSLAMRWRDDPEMQGAIGRAWCERIARAFPPLEVEAPRPRHTGKRIVLGYLTHDARAHAGGHMVRRLFSAHDRERFEVRVYATSGDDGSTVRREIAAACDAFVDVRALSHEETADRIRADGVDILIDLNGWSEGGRLETCALRPASVQATYVGFPASTGAAFFDYVIVDQVVAPPEHAPFFAEKFAWVPNTYQINDGVHLPESDEWSRRARRAAEGLPENAIVFASFNQAFKIEPVAFAAWMEILQAVPGSVLWLLDDNALATEALGREAAAREIDPSRLVFAPRRPRDRHFARLPLADCGLDTRVCNGHTTTTDMLCVGVPVVAQLGTTFAGRVSASLLRAHGLPELVTANTVDYTALAIRLGRDREALAALKARVRANAATHPLLDTARTVRNLERLYLAMWENHLAGRPPAALRIDDPI